MTTLKIRKDGVRYTGERREGDFYPTPPEVTTALLDLLGDDFFLSKPIWEPACGDGAISKVLAERGHEVINTDLSSRGLGESGKDFLTATELHAPTIFTNPPFLLAAEFIEKSIELKARRIVMLTNADFWHAKNRNRIWSRWQPRMICALTWRPNFYEGKGAVMYNCIWNVWDYSHSGPTEYHRLSRPIDARQKELVS